MLMNVASYARYRAVDKQVIVDLIAEGKIRPTPDGKIDAEAANLAWPDGLRPVRATKVKRRVVGLSPDSAGAAPKQEPLFEDELPDTPMPVIQCTNGAVTSALAGKLLDQSKLAPVGLDVDITQFEAEAVLGMDYNSARTVRALYDAKMKQLFYRKTAGVLVPRSEVEDEAFTAYRQLRDAILNIPSRLAAQVAAESDVSKIHAMLEAELRAAMANLARKYDREDKVAA